MKYLAIFVIPVLFYLGFIPINTTAQTAYLRSGFSLNNSKPKSTFYKNPTDSGQSHFAIKINPLQWLYDDIRIGFEYSLSRGASLELKIGLKSTAINPYELKYVKYEYSFFNDSTGQNETLRYNCTGFNIGLAGNFYFNNFWYLQPRRIPRSQCTGDNGAYYF